MSELTEVVASKLQGWLKIGVSMLPNFVLAVIVLLVFVASAKWIAQTICRGMRRLSHNEQLLSLVTSSVRASVVLAGVFISLTILELERTVTSLLAGVGVLGLALGFAFQDIAANFMSGLIMAWRQPFAVGALVDIKGHYGIVERVTLRATVVRLFSGQLVILPNKDVLQSAIINYSQTGERRVDLEVGISYGDDLEKVKRVATQAVQSIAYRNKARDVEFYFKGFGSSSIDFDLRFWLDLHSSQANFLEARSLAVMAVKKAFDEHGVTIPFPIRTLDFGIKGGQRLEAQLQNIPAFSKVKN